MRRSIGRERPPLMKIKAKDRAKQLRISGHGGGSSRD